MNEKNKKLMKAYKNADVDLTEENSKNKSQNIQNAFFVREKKAQSERMKNFVFIKHINERMDLYKHKKHGYKECFWRDLQKNEQ